MSLSVKPKDAQSEQDAWLEKDIQKTLLQIESLEQMIEKRLKPLVTKMNEDKSGMTIISLSKFNFFIDLFNRWFRFPQVTQHALYSDPQLLSIL